MDVETSNNTNSPVKAWLGAMRLRTLPLALASTLTGGFLAMQQGSFNVLILVLTAVTTVLLQINSNLANDYGDFEHGTDNAERIGPERVLQSGALNSSSMRRAIGLFSFLSLICGSALLWMAPIDLIAKGVLFILGLAAIYASIRYTAGSNPYGYRGLGDISVMAFFGVLGVVGAYYLQTASISYLIFLPALAIGCFSAGVLNVNNTRDLESDRNSGKITLAVRLGPKRARQYHLVLLMVGMLALGAYGLVRFESPWSWLFVLVYPLIILNAWKVYSTKEAAQLDPWLKQLAIATFLMSVLLAVGIAL